MAGRVRAALTTALALFAFLALSATSGSAVGLTGQSLSAAYYHPDLSTVYSGASWSPGTFTVGAGEETTGNIEDVTWLHVDFEADALTITFETVLSSPTWNIDRVQRRRLQRRERPRRDERFGERRDDDERLRQYARLVHGHRDPA